MNNLLIKTIDKKIGITIDEIDEIDNFDYILIGVEIINYYYYYFYYRKRIIASVSKIRSVDSSEASRGESQICSKILKYAQKCSIWLCATYG